HPSLVRAVCVNAPVRICAGGDQQWSSLPRQLPLNRIAPGKRRYWKVGIRAVSRKSEIPTRGSAQRMSIKSHQFWIGVVSRQHAHLGVEGGFIQLNHGKKAPLQSLRAGDGVVMYSPRTAYPDGEVLQSFTAIGVVHSGEVYRVKMAEDFEPYRVNVNFFKAKE